MNETITKIVNSFFEDVLETEETTAMREEILNNCQERFRDLILGGVDRETATQVIMESLKGMEEVIGQYPRKGGAAADEQAFSQAGFDSMVYAPQSMQPQQGVEKKYVFYADGLRKVMVKLVADSLEIEASSDGKVHVYCEDEEVNLDVRLSGGVLIIERTKTEEDDPQEEEEDNGYDLFRLGSMLKKLLRRSIKNFTEGDSPTTVHLLLPKSCTPEMEISVTSGDCMMKGMTLENLRLTTTSGYMYLDGVTAKQAKVNTTSGDVDWKGSCEILGATSVSGDITLEGEFVQSKLNSVSGDVYAVLTSDRLDRFHAQSVSGDLELGLPEGSRACLNLKTVSGEINQCVANALSGAAVEMKTVSGDIDIY